MFQKILIVVAKYLHDTLLNQISLLQKYDYFLFLHHKTIDVDNQTLNHQEEAEKIVCTSRPNNTNRFLSFEEV